MSGMDPDRIFGIVRWMQSYVDNGRLAGLSVQISHHGKIANSQHYGQATARLALCFMKKAHSGSSNPSPT